jgi:hypothetical protein
MLLLRLGRVVTERILHRVYNSTMSHGITICHSRVLHPHVLIRKPTMKFRGEMTQGLDQNGRLGSVGKHHAMREGRGTKTMKCIVVGGLQRREIQRHKLKRTHWIFRRRWETSSIDLSPCWETNSIFKKWFAVYGTRRFIIMLTRARSKWDASSLHTTILLLCDPFQYHHPVYAQIFTMVSFFGWIHRGPV